MPVGADGVMEAVFDASAAQVMLTVHGDEWSLPPGVTQADIVAVTITRSVPGDLYGAVRVADRVPVVNGWFVGADHEMPLDSSVTYLPTAHFAVGDQAGSSVTLSTSGARWGLWLKAPGDPLLTCMAKLQGAPESRSSSTIGGAYQVIGGPNLAVWGGVAAEQMTLTVRTYTQGETAALGALLDTTRVLLLQTGQPEEFPAGYYFVPVVSRVNPGQSRSDFQPIRDWTLQVERVARPAGEGRAVTGVTYEDVRQTFDSYQDVLDGTASYLDLMTGA